MRAGGESGVRVLEACITGPDAGRADRQSPRRTEKRISEGLVRMDNRSGLILSALEVQTILSVARSAHIEVLSSRTLTFPRPRCLALISLSASAVSHALLLHNEL